MRNNSVNLDFRNHVKLAFTTDPWNDEMRHLVKNHGATEVSAILFHDFGVNDATLDFMGRFLKESVDLAIKRIEWNTTWFRFAMKDGIALQNSMSNINHCFGGTVIREHYKSIVNPFN